MEKSFKTAVKAGLGSAMFGLSLAAQRMSFAFAGNFDDDDPTSFLTNGGSGSAGADMFSPLADLSANMAASIRTLVMVISIMVILVVLIISAVGYTSAQPQKKEMAKERMIRSVVAVVIVAAALNIVTFAFTFGRNVGSSLEDSASTMTEETGDYEITPTPRP